MRLPHTAFAVFAMTKRCWGTVLQHLLFCIILMDWSMVFSYKDVGVDGRGFWWKKRKDEGITEGLKDKDVGINRWDCHGLLSVNLAMTNTKIQRQILKAWGMSG